MGVDEARSLAVFLCAAHDCGKLSPTFQRQAPDLAHTLLDGERARWMLELAAAACTAEACSAQVKARQKVFVTGRLLTLRRRA